MIPKNYRVSWSINVAGESPHDAAHQALRIMVGLNVNDPEGALLFRVAEAVTPQGTMVTIVDLADDLGDAEADSDGE